MVWHVGREAERKAGRLAWSFWKYFLSKFKIFKVHLFSKYNFNYHSLSKEGIRRGQGFILIPVQSAFGGHYFAIGIASLVIKIESLFQKMG